VLQAPVILQIVPYDPQWPDCFQLEQTRVLDAVGDWISTVHHLGSTSVVGLAAKPKIDMYFTSPHAFPQATVHQQILDLGYTHSEHSERLGHAAYNRDEQLPAYTLHWYAEGHPDILRAIYFRDRLRNDEQLCARYAQVKQRAVASCDDDRWVYNEHKAAFILEVLSVFQDENRT
jgi:GrpB-like predicted nucleotidyltransferase (UPF0157 family)